MNSSQEIHDTCKKIGMSDALTNDLLTNLPHKRSSRANNALHLLFRQMADALNDTGRTFVFKGLKGIDIEVKYTEALVKETIWKPLQNALLEKSSTTQLTSKDIDLIFEILNKWFGEQGIQILFPCSSICE